MAEEEEEEQDLAQGSIIPSLYKPASLLPIARLKDQLLYTIETYPVTIVVGETGSGKTTQIPRFLYDAGWTSDGSSIAVTQPRRIAATSVAARVAEEMGCKLGQEVGYSIRFEDVTSAATRVKFLTDGLLLREMLVDPLLKRYSVVMVDEAHERSLSSDVLLGLLKKVVRRRGDLRVVVASATLDAERFKAFFEPEGEEERVCGRGRGEVACVVGIEGRVWPVEVQFLREAAEDYVERAVETVMEIHASEGPGDILVFLTGREEIETAIDMIADRMVDLEPGRQRLQPLPLYAGLPTDQQMYVFEEAGEDTRKVIVSTNIAEASVTIDGIVYVVDSGFVKLRVYDPTLGIERLNVCPVSRASAIQRAGRAGRTRPGKCFRLYTESTFNALEAATTPEIQRSNLAPMALQLMNLGIQNLVRFDYLSPPPSTLLIRAMDLLGSLGAVDATTARLTKPLGTRMAELPLPPMLAKCLLNAPSFGCLSEMLTIAAMMTLNGNVFISHSSTSTSKAQEEKIRRRFAVTQGDAVTLYNIYTSFHSHSSPSSSSSTNSPSPQWCRENNLNFKSLIKATSVRKQLRNHLSRLGIEENAGLSGPEVVRAGGMGVVERVQRCLASGFFAQAARMQSDGTFRTAGGGATLWPHPTSIFFHRKADWVVYGEILETRGKVYIRDLTAVEMEWLVESAPEYYKVTQK
ncbi:P-loop containing nucleoside triphosphate hydrolase protein [Aaosphaeria arxii CBS 175.79]|uniref:RNA helicase n=1 Tax=Aaosphaeria arxii CBS 175.79 TaxID=1450172 RepID=A0A6A5XB63_9PLEO|nr:P-loop containing nucleoside triphosphate hydrolase protein [Aaosphaeria arxii CBS 175.79]KAF2010143.1 P-loop containing nucleoside triphosphate hydrolase protein [Aaosphaeria arxii CBS 175.79]